MINLMINLREDNRGRLAFGPGYDLDRGLSYTAELGYKNLFGYGRHISLRTSLSEERHQFAIDKPETIAQQYLGKKIGVGYRQYHLLDGQTDALVTLNHNEEAFSEIWSKQDRLGVILEKTVSIVEKNKLFFGYELAENEERALPLSSLLHQEIAALQV